MNVHLRRARAAREGSVVVVAALLLPAMLVLGALALDFGAVLLAKRRLQAATDAGALAAVRAATDPQAAAARMLAANGLSAARVSELTTGRYVASSSVAPGARYVAGLTPANAAHLATRLDVPLMFAQMLRPNITIGASATATNVDLAGLVAGSGLASVDAPLLNAVLGGLLGTNLTLSAVQYQGLLATNMSGIDFLDALAAQNGLVGGTYGDLMGATVGLRSVLAAQMAALQPSGSSASALGALTAVQSALVGDPAVTVGTLMDATAWSGVPIGALDRSLSLKASVNVYQLLAFAAQIGNGANLVTASNALNIPGIARVDLRMTGIEPAQGSYYTLGPVGTIVHTSQVRLLLTVNLLSALSLGTSSGVVSLPVYIELADGTASTTAIACGANPASDTTVTVRAQSGVANAYIASVSPAAMTNYTQPVARTPATLVNVAGLIKITGSAQASVQDGGTTLVFTAAQIAAGTAQTVSGANMSATFMRDLSNSLTLTPTLLGLPLPLPLGIVTANLRGLLQPVFNALDGVVDTALTALGIRLGYLDVTVTGARCGVPALVQ